MSERKLAILLTSLECIKASPGPGYDELYFVIWADEEFVQMYPKKALDGEVFEMNEDANMRFIDLNFTVHFGTTVKMQLREQDRLMNPLEDDNMGWVSIKVDDMGLADTGIKKADFISNEEESHYRLRYRLVSQKLPTLRILALGCQLSSCNCNKDRADLLFGLTEQILEATGAILAATMNPDLELAAEALEIAAGIVVGVQALFEWIANSIEGDDDVFLQHTIENQQAHDHVAICPPDGGYMEMNDNVKIHFMSRFKQYIRVPLDMGNVSIEAREYDPNKHDASLGAMTVSMADYKKYVNKGSMCRPLATYYDNRNGEGSIYHICYCFTLEDWTLPPNQE